MDSSRPNETEMKFYPYFPTTLQQLAFILIVTLWNLSWTSATNSIFTHDTTGGGGSGSFLDRNEPEFVEDIKNVTVATGREAVLRCVVDNLGKYKVGWIRAEDQTILTLDTKVVTHNGRVGVSNLDKGVWNLHIKGVKESDRGCYMCQINTAVMRKQVGCLDVHVSPSIIDEETSTDLTVREGENVTLVCKASGRPKPKIIWRREDGESIMLRRGLRDVYKGYEKIVGETLQFIRIDRRQMGSILCIASNDVPPAKSKRIVLDVNFPPLVKVQNQLLGAPFGSNLTLACEIQAMPKAFVYWTIVKTGEMILDSSKYTIEEKRHSYKITTSLTIRNFGPKDVGIFNCIATNSLGKGEGSIRLHEIKLKQSTSTTVHHNHHLVTLSGYATPPISTEGGVVLTNNGGGGSLWGRNNNYEGGERRGGGVDRPRDHHETQTEVKRNNDIPVISSSSSSSSQYWRWRRIRRSSSSSLYYFIFSLAQLLSQNYFFQIILFSQLFSSFMIIT